MIAPSAAQAPSVRLPFQYIIAGIIFFLLSQIFMLDAGPHLLEGNFRTPKVWGMAHLLILGWATMIAIGAMFQLVPVAFLVPIFSEKMGHVQFYLMTLSLIGFVLGFMSMNRSWLIACGAFLVLGFGLFIFNMLASFRKVQHWNMLSRTVFSALVYLSLTILLGLLLVIQLTMGIFPSSWHSPILYTHITMGLVGWFSLLIYGFSYKMVPMFSLAHDFSLKLSHAVFYLFHAGILFLILFYWVGNSALLLIGAVLLLVSSLAFLLLIRGILKHRMKKKLDRAFQFSLLAIPFGVLIHALIVFWLVAWLNHTPWPTQWLVILVYLYAMLWISLCIASYLYKIIPFLWWTKKYSLLAGKEKVPMLKDLISEKTASVILTGMVVSICGVASSLLLIWKWLFYISQIGLILVVLSYAYTLFMIFKK